MVLVAIRAATLKRWLSFICLSNYVTAQCAHMLMHVQGTEELTGLAESRVAGMTALKTQRVVCEGYVILCGSSFADSVFVHGAVCGSTPTGLIRATGLETSLQAVTEMSVVAAAFGSLLRFGLLGAYSQYTFILSGR